MLEPVRPIRIADDCIEVKCGLCQEHLLIFDGESCQCTYNPDGTVYAALCYICAKVINGPHR